MKLGKVFKSVVRIGTGGLSDAIGLTKDKTPKVADTAAQDLAKEKEEDAKKRVKLFATEGAETGEEVFSVDEARKRRGSIFGN